MDELQIILEHYRERPYPFDMRHKPRRVGIEIQRPFGDDVLSYTFVFIDPDGSTWMVQNFVSETAVRADFFGMLNRIHDYLDCRGPDPGREYYSA